MDKVAKLRNELEALQKGIDNPSTPANFKEKMRSTMTVIQGKIDAELKKEGTPEKKTRKSAPKKESSRGGRKDNASFKKAQEIAKELKAKDPSLPHTKAISMAWASMKGEAPKKETPKKEAPKKEAPKKEDTKTRAKNLKAKVKKVGGTYSYKVKGETKTFTRDKDKDGVRYAKPVGKRVSAEGNTYYEYRDNRADTNIGKSSYKKPRLFDKGGYMYEDGGRLSDMADYVTKYKVKSVEVEMDGKTVTLDGSQLMDGIYVKKNSFEYGGMMAKGGKSNMFYVGQSIFFPITNNRKLDKSVRNFTNKYAERELVIEKINDGKPYNTAKVFDRKTGDKLPFEVSLNPRYVQQYADGGIMANGGELNSMSDEKIARIYANMKDLDYSDVIIEIKGNRAERRDAINEILRETAKSGNSNEMEDGGMTGGMYKIVDLDGDTVKSNLTEQGVIEFADTLGYYEAQDNEQEPIYNLDSAISLIEMEGDYNVVKMAEYGGFMKRGGDTGNYNYGRSYFQDRARIAKGQDYEKYYHRKGK
jgi:hypothetical protein